MSEPQRVLICVPCMDYKQYTLNVMGLVSVLAASNGMAQPYWINGNSDIRSCRNEAAHYFKKQTEFDTLFFLDSDIVFTLKDYLYVLEGDDEIVIAPYSRKALGAQPTKVGMGFCRISRGVFERLDNWTSAEGEEMLRRYYKEGGEIVTDYFVNGATVDARWLGEDSGFWHWCSQMGEKPRFETRTTLGHAGMFVYGYPDQLMGHAATTRVPELLPDND
jgi:hypothetical protein